MRKQPSNQRVHRALSIAAVAATCGAAQAQTVFSIEYRGPTIAVPSTCTGVPITEGDLLTPATGGVPALGPLAPPCIFITAGPGGLGLPTWAACVGHPPGMPCGVEVDAVSFGTDGPLLAAMPPGRVAFSVDKFAKGIAGVPKPPAVWTEGPPISEAAGDVFVDLGLPAGPIPPAALGIGHTGMIDGNGMAFPSAFAYPGVGIIEPLPPGCALPDPGDNLDAIDVDGPLGSAIVFFSLDAGFVDPLCGMPYSGSAAANGLLPGMVVAKPLGGAAVIYAAPPMLGLDLVGGAGSDDLDALAVFENGVAGFQPSPGPYMGWGGATDMMLFSVRRGSAVVGMPDSIFGVPIEPGDILIPPVAGGGSPFPGILYSAESIGLATARSFAMPFGDELDALDIIRVPRFDCNQNGIEDAVDIAMGATDCNLNGIPDKCEFSGVTTYCTGKVNSNGCVPSIGFAGPDIVSVSCAASGAVANITVTNLSPRPGAPSHIGQLFYSTTGPSAIPFLGGTLCVKGPIKRIPPLVNTGGTIGSTTLCDSSVTQDFNARIASGVDPALIAGATVWCQGWARDTAPFLGVQLSNALTFTIAP
jgi:hypothetical protein